jgi:endoglucanase
LQDDWKTVWPDKLALLQRLWDGTTTTPPPPTTPPPTTGITATLKTSSDWGSGYCADVTVKNAGTVAVQWKVDVTIQGKMNNSWNAVTSQAGTTLTATGVDWNKTVQPNSTQSFGFCAAR